MSTQTLISKRNMISKVPSILAGLPSLVKGLKIANTSDKSKSVGLGLCIEKCVNENPDGLAILYQDRQLTYLEFNRWINRLAHYFLAQGIQKGDCIAIMIDNRPELLAAVGACAKIGAIAAMVNTAQKGKVLSYSINLVEPKMMLVGQECLEAYQAIREESHVPEDKHYYLADQNTLTTPSQAPEGWQNLAELVQGQSDNNPSQCQSIYPDDPCFYIYTSGTTGMPKAVVFNHGRYMKAYGSFGFASVRLKASDRMYVPLPFYHATAMAICWSSVLAGNACLVMTKKFSASGFWSDVKKYQATSFGYVGELCRYLVEQAPMPHEAENSIRIIVGNGMRASIWDEFKQRFDIPKIMEFYASSEGNIGFTNVLNFDRTVGFSPYPYALVEYDKENDKALTDANGKLRKVKRGEVGLLIGEITAKSPFHGYTDTEKSEKCIMRNVFKEGDAWFNTGDLMRDIGFRHAQFVDRTGDTFRWKGENVSTTEVEMLIDAVDNVSETVVYGVEIPNTNGRAGMASIRLDCQLEEFDFNNMLNELKKDMPNYAIPLFLRISKGVEMTGTFKHKKVPLKEDGFCLNKVQEPLYVRLPNTEAYVPLTQELQAEIEQGTHRF
ncbi:long-chain-acyl-CoA synthetase [Marinomonas sp. PE14-40]|uniref:long-chain-acyl-CoA synthetase n=1 Tax=Marinomonas sp. PE14-40 TaxID=3060621 RepID=UPI003F6632E1